MEAATKTKIQELREQRGMSKSELGRRVGATYQTIYNLELERHKPGAELLLKLSHELGTTMEELLK